MFDNSIFHFLHETMHLVQHFSMQKRHFINILKDEFIALQFTAFIFNIKLIDVLFLLWF